MASLHEIVTHSHLEHGVDAGEGVDHHADEGAIARPDKCRFARFLAVLPLLSDDLDAVQQLAGLVGRQHGRLAFLDVVSGAAHGVGRVHVEDAAPDKPVEQHAQRGKKVLFDGRRGKPPAGVAPCREAGGVQVRLAGVVVVDLGGEEFQDPLGGLRRRREKRGGPQLGEGGEDD